MNTIPKTAQGAIVKNRIVRNGTTAAHVAQASATTDRLVGIYDGVTDAADTAQVLVRFTGVGRVEAGGTIGYGMILTTDSDGRAVQAAPAVGNNARTIGVALEAASVGQVFRILIQPGQVQG